MNRNMSATLTAAFYLVCTSVAFCAGPEGAVSGNGRVVIRRQPQILRAQLPLTADGKDIAEAASSLKARQASIGKKLVGLGAIEKSIDPGTMQVGVSDARMRYMQQMYNRNNRAPKPAGPQMVTVSCTMKAEFPVSAGDAEQLLISSYTLQEKIKAAAAQKEVKKLTPEEQEALEEAAAMNGGNAASEASFQYVAKVNEEDQAKAMAEAFAQARADAARVAKATGGELGALRHVSSASSSPTGTVESDEQAYMRAFMRQMTGASLATSDSQSGEAVAPVAGPVELQVIVTAVFDLK